VETIRVIKDGYGCDAGLLPDGWFAAVAMAHDFDAACLEDFGRYGVAFREGKTEAQWTKAFTAALRRLVLITRTNGTDTEEVLAEAERIEGPAATSGPEPAPEVQSSRSMRAV